MNQFCKSVLVYFQSQTIYIYVDEVAAAIELAVPNMQQNLAARAEAQRGIEAEAVTGSHMA